jgi:NhaP-type Na+/H+ or K+/H+ antiporter
MMMTPDDRSMARWLSLQRRVLLVLALLTSAATAVVVGFGLYLIFEAYAGPSGPESLGGLAFLLGAIVLVVVGLPAAVTSGLAWAGYAAATRRSRCLPR